jgi:signal peptidase I
MEPTPYETETPVETPAPEASSPRMRKRLGGCLLEIVETIVLTIVIFFLVQHFVAQPYQIQQVSMENTLQPGQYVLVDKLSPLWSDYKRGDVIVFEPPKGYQEDGQDIPFIKRVIGVAGDLVEIKHDDVGGWGVFVNGVRLDEPYVYLDQPTTPLTDTASWRVPDGQLFVLGDHREASQDSRYFGPIPKSSVIGRALLRYWPIKEFGIIEAGKYQGVPDASHAPAAPSPSPSGKP